MHFMHAQNHQLVKYVSELTVLNKKLYIKKEIFHIQYAYPTSCMDFKVM